MCERGLFPSLLVVLVPCTKSYMSVWFVSLSGGHFNAILQNLVCGRDLFPSLVIVLMLFYEILYVSVVCFPVWRSF